VSAGNCASLRNTARVWIDASELLAGEDVELQDKGIMQQHLNPRRRASRYGAHQGHMDADLWRKLPILTSSYPFALRKRATSAAAESSIGIWHFQIPSSKFRIVKLILHN
jgi:hypothetical protein